MACDGSARSDFSTWEKVREEFQNICMNFSSFLSTEKRAGIPEKPYKL
jgi:hypothetical protein